MRLTQVLVKYRIKKYPDLISMLLDKSVQSLLAQLKILVTFYNFKSWI